MVSDTFEQLQQVRGYYSVPSVLDVDRYQIDGRERDVVLAAREMNLDGLPDAQKKWANEHTVYTHGYGMIAAYGNQQDAEDKPVTNNKGEPVWAEEDLPPVGELTNQSGDGYRPQIYFGERSPTTRSSASPEAASRRARRAAGRQHAQLVEATTYYQGKTGVGDRHRRSTSCSTR